MHFIVQQKLTQNFEAIISQFEKKKETELITILPNGPASKESACNVGDTGSIPRKGRFSSEGNGNPLQYSFLGNPMDKGTWWTIVHKVTKSWTQLSD